MKPQTVAARPWWVTLLALTLLIPLPVASLLIRGLMGELRFDGLSIIVIALAALGGWILTRGRDGEGRHHD